MVLRIGPFDGVPENRHELNVRKSLEEAPRDTGMKDIINARLSSDETPSVQLFYAFLVENGREMFSVPVETLREISIEKMNFFSERWCDTWMLDQIAIGTC